MERLNNRISINNNTGTVSNNINGADKTALMQACIDGNIYIVQKLLSVDKSGINKQDSEGKTALMYACCNTSNYVNPHSTKVKCFQLTQFGKYPF